MRLKGLRFRIVRGVNLNWFQMCLSNSTRFDTTTTYEADPHRASSRVHLLHPKSGAPSLRRSKNIDAFDDGDHNLKRGGDDDGDDQTHLRRPKQMPFVCQLCRSDPYVDTSVVSQSFAVGCGVGIGVSSSAVLQPGRRTGEERGGGGGGGGGGDWSGRGNTGGGNRGEEENLPPPGSVECA